MRIQPNTILESGNNYNVPDFCLSVQYSHLFGNKYAEIQASKYFVSNIKFCFNKSNLSFRHIPFYLVQVTLVSED